MAEMEIQVMAMVKTAKVLMVRMVAVVVEVIYMMVVVFQRAAMITIIMVVVAQVVDNDGDHGGPGGGGDAVCDGNGNVVVLAGQLAISMVMTMVMVVCC